MRHKYPLKEKIFFYWSYFSSKVFGLWFEVERPRFLLFVYEMLYSSKKIINGESLMPSPFNVDFVVTKYGKYHIRPGTTDLSVVSPAFERRDMQYLSDLTLRLRSEGKSVLCLDIGANIGVFSLLLGNMHKDDSLLRIVAFEPGDSNYRLLQRNIRENNLGESIESFKIALHSEDHKDMYLLSDPKVPGSSYLKSDQKLCATHQKIDAMTLDTMLGNRIDTYDSLIFKMDVEGAEADVLQGAKKILNSGKEIWLLVEDFVNPRIVDYLEGLGAEFLTKLTPYNSWWRLGKNG
jgi:FkbM family methyltransferase